MVITCIIGKIGSKLYLSCKILLFQNILDLFSKLFSELHDFNINSWVYSVCMIHSFKVAFSIHHILKIDAVPLLVNSSCHIKYLRLGGLPNRNSSSHSSGGWQSKFKGLADSISAEGSLPSLYTAGHLLGLTSWGLSSGREGDRERRKRRGRERENFKYKTSFLWRNSHIW